MLILTLAYTHWHTRLLDVANLNQKMKQVEVHEEFAEILEQFPRISNDNWHFVLWLKILFTFLWQLHNFVLLATQPMLSAAYGKVVEILILHKWHSQQSNSSGSRGKGCAQVAKQESYTYWHIHTHMCQCIMLGSAALWSLNCQQHRAGEHFRQIAVICFALLLLLLYF